MESVRLKALPSPPGEADPNKVTIKMDALYEAAVEAVDESVINALVQGEDVPTVKPPGQTCVALDTDELCRVMRRYGRM